MEQSKSRNFCLLCSLLYTQHLELCPAQNKLFVEWMNKPGVPSLSYSATQSCILHHTIETSKASHPFLTQNCPQVNSRNLKCHFPIKPSSPLPPPVVCLNQAPSLSSWSYYSHISPIISIATIVTLVQATISPAWDLLKQLTNFQSHALLIQSLELKEWAF